MKKIIISTFKKMYAKYFYQLNKDWITESWELEKSDLKDLLDPEKNIIKLGGEIFFIVINNQPIATAAMIANQKNSYELAKMTVKKEFRGKGYSKILLERCIDFAQKRSAKEIYLISNSKLKIARKLYDNHGFIKVALDNKKYHRGDLKMVLYLK